jgi:hypothetical protein
VILFNLLIVAFTAFAFVIALQKKPFFKSGVTFSA